jgi:hypothetical protein
MKEDRKKNSNNENLPFCFRIKQYKMLFRYYFRNFWKKVSSTWPIILFVISLFLFSSVLAPNVAHRQPIWGEWPIVLELHGSVFVQTNENQNSGLIPVSRALIEVGGYSAITDPDGMFHIKFVSKSFNNIPVIIQWSNKTVIKRVSFESGQFEKTEVFILNEK